MRKFHSGWVYESLSGDIAVLVEGRDDDHVYLDDGDTKKIMFSIVDEELIESFYYGVEKIFADRVVG